MIKNLAMIACISKDRGIGRDNALLWQIPEDMKFFRQTTTGSMVVMGRKTLASIGRILPKRENVVLSRHPQDIPAVKWCTSKSELDELLAQDTAEKFIIGGASLYNMYIDDAETLYLTEVDAKKPASEFFPEFDKSKYTRQVLRTGEDKGIKYEIVKYSRK